MPPDAGPAGVVALSTAAVVLAALMLPAAGFGQLPAGVEPAPAGGPAPGSGPATATPAGGTTVPGDATPTPGTPDDAQATPTDGSSTEESSTDRPPTEGSPTDEATKTTTEPPSGPGGAGGESGPLAGFFSTVLVLLVCFASLVTLGLEGKRRQWPVFRSLPIPSVSVFGVVRSVAQGTVTVLVRLSTAVPQLVRGLGRVTDELSTALGDGLSGLGRALSTLLTSLPRTLAVPDLRLPDLSGLFSRSGRRAPADERPTSGGQSAHADETDRGPPTTIEDAWLRMARRLPINRWETRTPGELARIAIGHGLPERPVRRLTDAFRRVTYGRYDRSTDRTDDALSAYERIKRALEEKR